MNKSEKSSEEAEADRLSELPDSLIFEILGLLPMRDVVKTTILSKRWENLWTTTPYLDFQSYSWQCCDSMEFVIRASIVWRGLRILKFKFTRDRNPIHHDMSAFSAIDIWVRLAREYGVEEFYLKLHSRPYCVPHSLYACASLKVLSLKGCNLLKDHGNVQWNQLKSLTIADCLIDQTLIDKVMSGSPKLEVFIFNIWDRDDNLSIRSSSLKKLWIERCFIVEPSSDSELRIWSPNLETLDFVGVSYCKYSLINVPSLTHLTLALEPYHYGDCFGETLGQIFHTIQRVEKLTLSSRDCIMGVAAMKKKYLYLKFLSINDTNVEYKAILDILQILPKLETLVLHSTNNLGYWIPANRADSSERNLPSSFLLRTVEITCSKGDNLIIPFIEILLKHASKLQKMAIKVVPMKRPPMHGWFSAFRQKVLKVPRSSPTAELLIFAE